MRRTDVRWRDLHFRGPVTMGRDAMDLKAAARSIPGSATPSACTGWRLARQ